MECAYLQPSHELNEVNDHWHIAGFCSKLQSSVTIGKCLQCKPEQPHKKLGEY